MFTTGNSDLPDNSVLALAPGEDGALWVGTDGGLARLAGGQVDQVLTTEQGLPDNAVRALAPGEDGALWVGTGRGLARLAGGQVDQVLTTQHGLPGNWVLTLAPGEDGAIWVGTDGGLARLAGGQVEQVLTTQQVLPHNVVWALAPGEDGALWVGTQGGLALLAGGQVDQVLTTEHGLPHDSVQALAPGEDGALWVGTGDLLGIGGGLAGLAGGQVDQVLTTEHGLPSNSVLALAPGEDGALWVGTGDLLGIGGGLARLAGGQVDQVLTTQHGLPGNSVLALAPGEDGALWVGTDSGLARLAGGQVDRVLTTEQGLPDNSVTALAPGEDGALWVGTGGGLARLQPPVTPPRIIKLVGQLGGKGAKITQTQHTFAAIAFDPKYQTDGREWRFLWRLDPPSGGAGETRTRSSYYEASFEDDGRYTVTVQAIDEYGLKSDPYVYDFDVALPKEDPIEVWAKRIGGWGAAISAVYFLGLFPLLLLYPHASWARSAVNSGVFTKFPIIHKLILNSDWARRLVFRRHAEMSMGAARVPEHYIPQAIFRAVGTASTPLALDGASGSLAALFESSRRVLVLARSGTGKSVLLRFLVRAMAERFLRGEDRRLPVLIDLRTSPIAGRDVEALIRDALRGGAEKALEGGGVELPDDILDHLIRKGGFILLIDSLNELAEWKDAAAFHPFFNRDARNYAMVASQVDLLERPDFAIHSLAEVTAEQARDYLHEVTGSDIWGQLPAEARALARNPQDLVLLAEVVQALGPDRPVPSRRAELYREILSNDALADWAAAGGAAIRAVYGLAMRMVEERLVVGEEQLREWLRAELESREAFSEEVMAEVVGAIGRSRLFREETEVDVLGKRRAVTGFRHELVGKFLAARHVREVLATPSDERREAYLALSGEEAWLDLFYFIVDELDSKLALNALLKELLDRTRPPERITTESGEPLLTESGDFLVTEGDARLRIVAYALGTRPEDRILGEVRHAYNLAKLGEDLRRTPAA